jgi:inorganic pyrophosphatase
MLLETSQGCDKGYSIGSASMACFLLFGAFVDEFSRGLVCHFPTVNIRDPEVLVGGLIGMLSFTLLDLLLQQLVERRMVVIEVRQFGGLIS